MRNLYFCAASVVQILYGKDAVQTCRDERQRWQDRGHGFPKVTFRVESCSLVLLLERRVFPPLCIDEAPAGLAADEPR